MKKKLIVMALAALGPVAPTAAGPRMLVLPDGIVDLGEFEEKEVQTREVWVRNTGDEPLEILKVFSTCSCTRVDWPRVEIAPGDSAAMTVVFDGRRRKPGPVRKVFRLTTNAETPVTSVLVKGDIVKPFQK